MMQRVASRDASSDVRARQSEGLPEARGATCHTHTHTHTRSPAARCTLMVHSARAGMGMVGGAHSWVTRPFLAVM